MKRILAVVGWGVLLAGTAEAAPKSITLMVPGMSCPACPVTIKKTLLKQQGITAVHVMYAKKELEVEFDDAKITPAAIMQSTASIGFPSQVAK